MFVTADHFFVGGLESVNESESALGLGGSGGGEECEQGVTEFFREMRVVGGLGGFLEFGGFAVGIFNEVGGGLFAVPGAAFGATQEPGEVDEGLEPLIFGFRVDLEMGQSRHSGFSS